MVTNMSHPQHQFFFKNYMNTMLKLSHEKYNKTIRRSHTLVYFNIPTQSDTYVKCCTVRSNMMFAIDQLKFCTP